MIGSGIGRRPSDPTESLARGNDTTVLHYLRRATAFLAARGRVSPRLDAELLLAHVLATDRVGVYLAFDRPLAADEVDRYRELVRRRAGGEPVAYLLGRREFWSCDLAVTPDVLIPRPETELLVEHAVAHLAGRAGGARVLDLGTGSGALALALARERPDARVVAVDVSPGAARVARGNAMRAGVSARVAIAVADWATCILPAARFDVIVANPPYVAADALAHLPVEVRHEPRLALDGGVDGLACYRALVPQAAPLLAPGGRLLLEIGAGQASAVAALLAAAGLEGTTVDADLGGVQRVVSAVMPERL